MKSKWTLAGSVVAVLVLALTVGFSQAQGPQPPEGVQPQREVGIQALLGTAFTYQGQLKSGGNPVTGNCDFQFSLWDAASDGTQVGTTQTKTNVGVSNGYFTIADLDFGAGAFQGDARWLEIAVRCPAGSGSYTTLSPRQPLTPVPYALALPGLWTQQNGTSPNLIGGYSGNSVSGGVVGATIGGGGAAGATNRVTDYYGTIGGGRGNQAGDNTGAINSAPYATIGGGVENTASGAEATIGGGWSNTASGSHATVGGGFGNTASGAEATVGGGYNNTASNNYATVGGGTAHTASGSHATVSGGESNTASHPCATVGGGYNNTASNTYATVGGGIANIASGGIATVGGGEYNVASAAYATIAGGGPSSPTDPNNTNNRVTDDYGTIGGGGYNRAGNDDGDTTNAPFATVGGGYSNVANGYEATVGGGFGNTASGNSAAVGGGHLNTASGQYATVGGGESNLISGTASYATIAGGYNITVTGQYAAVGGGRDNVASNNYATVGGGRDNMASGEYATVGGGYGNTAQGHYSFAAGRRAKANNLGCFVWGDSTDADITCSNNNRTIFRSSGGYYIYTNSGLSSGVYVAAGGSAWNSVSNRALKENFAPVDTRQLLERLAAIPITTWNYKSQDSSIRHIGPMAADLNALVDGLGGEGPEYINSLDADGVALAAIQGLYQVVQEKDARIAALEGRVAALEAQSTAQQAQIDALEARLSALERQVGGASTPASVLPVPGLVLGGLAVLGAVVYRQRKGG